MFINLIGKNKELGRFLFCERYTLPPVKNAMYIAEGQDLKRGAVVDVNGVLVGTNSLMPYAVLEFDCDTRSGGKQASVFINGEFNFDKLYFAEGLEKSELDNIVYNGIGIGIVIKPYEYEEGFSPLMVQQSSNIAPNYTKKTYEANSYVMQYGVLYTNTNAIETAEDWNPAHWTQTTVAEMMAGAGGSAGYEQRSVNANVTDGVLLVTGVPNRSITVATGLTGSETVPWNIIIDNDCTDAIIILKLPTGYNMIPSAIDIKRVNESSLTLYGTKGQMVSAIIEDSDCAYDVIPFFNGIDGEPSSEVIIHICGDTALLSFTVV